MQIRHRPPGCTPDFLVLALDGGAAGQVPDVIHILPAGQVKSRKGEFLVDGEAAAAILQLFQERGIDVVIDYEHATLSGDPAPAAGWIKDLEFRQDGLWGRVEWTDRARDYLAALEYRYLSPVVLVRKSDGRAVYLHSVGLTNSPAIDGMEPIINSYPIEEESRMEEWLERLKYVLQLAADATWEQVVQTVQNLASQAQAAVSANSLIAGLLDLPATASSDQIRGKILALKNPAAFVPADQHTRVIRERDEARTQLAQRDAGDLVANALTAGKIAPAQMEWATGYALKDPAGFRAFVEQSPRVVPLGEVAGGKPNPGPAIDQAQLSINKQLGIDDVTYRKYFGGETA